MKYFQMPEEQLVAEQSTKRSVPFVVFHSKVNTNCIDKERHLIHRNDLLGLRQIHIQ